MSTQTFSRSVMVPRPIAGMRAPLASMVCMRSSTEERRTTASPDEANFNIKLKRRPDPVRREYRCCLTRRKRQAGAIAKGKPARSRVRGESTRPFSLRRIKIEYATGGHPQRGAGGVQRANPLDQLCDDFRMIDARHDRITDEPSDKVAAGLPMNERSEEHTSELQSHSFISY